MWYVWHNGYMTDRLSSDILEEQFGKTSLLIKFESAKERSIETRAADGKVLELSYVRFTTAGRQEFPIINQALTEGLSMGRAFRAANILFTRRTRFVSKIAPTPLLSGEFGESNMVWVVGVDILAGDSQTEYASIIEFYTGQVRWPDAPTVLTEAQQTEIAVCQQRLEAQLFG